MLGDSVLSRLSYLTVSYIISPVENLPVGMKSYTIGLSYLNLIE